MACVSENIVNTNRENATLEPVMIIAADMAQVVNESAHNDIVNKTIIKFPSMATFYWLFQKSTVDSWQYLINKGHSRLRLKKEQHT